jgi:hypothetical protein
MYGGGDWISPKWATPTTAMIFRRRDFCEADFAEVLSPAANEAERGITIFATRTAAIRASYRTIKKRGVR